jgi:hypothetical protein
MDPVTVHVAVGTDIIHIHPGADGAAMADQPSRLGCSAAWSPA